MWKKDKIENSLASIRKNVPLEEFTTFKIGGKARYFFLAKSKNDLIRGVIFAGKNNLPFFILGGGSNLLISDAGFKGLIIKLQIINYKLQNTKISAEAGTRLGELVGVLAKNGLAGLEWAVGIPGTLGGAIFGNAGAFKESIGMAVKEVEFFDSEKLKFGKLKNKNCKFGYRKSIFKRRKNLIIISAVLQLNQGRVKEIKNKIKGYLTEKQERQPIGLPSAGSIFVNPGGFSAAKLIEQCGLKGKRIGDVEISKKHANFIVNLGGGSAKDVIKLINLTKKTVKNKFGVNLKEEIQFLGFKNKKLVIHT